MNKKIFLIIVLLLFLAVAVVFLIISKKGSDVEVEVPINTDPLSSVDDDKSDLIVVTSPLPNATSTNPLVIEGKARGSWFFEASFPVKLYDSQGVLLSTAIAKADGNWMTEDFVPFIASLQFTLPTNAKNGMLVLEKDNPSGLIELDNKLEIPVLFEPVTGSQRKVKIYYYNPEKDMDENGNLLCSSKGLVAVERSIPFTSTPVRDTISLLLKGGLTESERSSGLSTEYPLWGVELNGAALNNEILTLNITDPKSKTVGGSCRVSILRAQIEETARQFSGINSVMFINQSLFQP